MKKFFKGSSKSKEKERRKIERTQEDDFLYGRSKSNGNSGQHRPYPRHAQDSFAPTQEPMAESVGYNDNTYREGNVRHEISNTLGGNFANISNISLAENSHASMPVGTNPPPPSSLLGLDSPPTRGSMQFPTANVSHAPSSNAYAPAPARGGGGGGSTTSFGKSAGMTQEENDRQMKQRLRDERKKQSQYTASTRGGGGDSLHSSGHSSSLSKSTFDERLYRHSAYEEDDNYNHSNNESMKQPFTSAEREQEERRRKTRERAERDRKIKEGVRREQQQSGHWAGDQTSAADAEMEEKRRRQREQQEKDRKIKEEVRRQTTKPAPRVGNQTSAAGRELEEKRRRQREQQEQDRKIKQSVRKQTMAVKEHRSSAGLNSAWEQGDQQHVGSDAAWERNNAADTDEGFKERQRRRLQNNSKKKREKHVSILADPDEFEEDLQTLQPYERGGFAATKEEEEEHLEKSQHLIDMHLAQLKATSKISTMEDEEHRKSQNLIDMHIAQLKATSKISTMEDEDYDFIDPNARLSEFEEQEAKRNRNRRISRRVSHTTMKINAWNEKIALKKAVKMAERSPEMEWLSSFYRTDPRYQIMKFFDEVARDGGKATEEEDVGMGILAGLFNKASVFTVWRPTSDEAIKNMMTDRATGKGLDIKGKSAKRGNISSYVPFIQIYEEAHKEHVRAMIKDGKVVRVFYKSEKARFEAYEMILDIKDYMLFAAQDACRVLSDEYADPEEQELAMQHLMYDDVSLNVQFVDTFANSSTPVYGMDITERLFWESYVMKASCERPPGTEWDIGRNSEPAFMDFNLKSIRTIVDGAPRAVVYQMSEECPMDPRKLLMAYEEHGRVKPVVSDFDCFLLGSRGVKYKEPIPQDQIELVKWSVKNISEVLDERAATGSTAGWMNAWFKVLKKAASKGYYPKTPKYGNGDPKSYEIVEVAVSRLQSTGCVRHGAECFNWFFPQEIDEDFLVISDTLPGNKKWKKVKVPELQEILIDKIGEGFTFPINPKWVLCDPGWRRVYDKLLASQKPNVQDSIKCWLPPGTGLREQIDAISARHPHGFEGGTLDPADVDGTAQRDLMEENLERYVKVQRAWRKLRLLLFWIRFVREKRREREENERDAMDKSSFQY